MKLSATLQSALLHMQAHPGSILTEQDIPRLGQYRNQVQALITRQFLVPENSDPITPFLTWFAVRPAQNPAIAYRSETGELIVAHTSMSHFTFSPRNGVLPRVIEESMPPLAAQIYAFADGARTLIEILKSLYPITTDELPEACRDDLNFLTSPERQLIKFAAQSQNLDNPYQPFNSVPRSVSHSANWDRSAPNVAAVIDFHQYGIEDASWEFDWIEPTINHAFRFPSDALGGLDYGSRFCEAMLKPDMLPLLEKSSELKVLEIGGGTGTFAASFITKISKMDGVSRRLHLDYHILDLSPALIRSQKRVMANLPHPVLHFQQDATAFDLPDRKFDLIIANEVIADLPTAVVRRQNQLDQTDGCGNQWEGEGARDVTRFDLSIDDAPDEFLVNSGAFRLLERIWEHLAPGGTAVLTEYGGREKYAVELRHLSHVESSIHFGHVKACGERLGFQTRLLELTEFLNIDDETLMLNGSSEQIFCLNHVLDKFGISLPYAAISKREFESRFREVVEKNGLSGFSFSPLKAGFHFGPDIKPFLVLILNKPLEPHLTNGQN